jgi:hypothetical protein
MSTNFNQGEQNILSNNKITNKGTVIIVVFGGFGFFLLLLLLVGMISFGFIDIHHFAAFMMGLFMGIISFAQWVVIGAAVCAALWFVIHFVVKPIVDMRRGKIHYANDHFAIYSGEVKVHDHKEERNTYNWRGEIGEAQQLALPSGELPQLVRYEDVKRMVPAGHTLIGVGPGGRAITRPRDVNALIWIVGNSGMGKTNTVMLRIDEDSGLDTQFLGVDPHYFKEDSLAHAISGTKYEARFITPTDAPYENGTRFASETNDIIQVCDAYLAEFERRRGGGTWKRPLRLVIDEASALTFKPTSPREKDMVSKIQRVAQISGQQTRDFDMGCMLITQTATGMAWLRKYALVVYVHKLLMMNERELACNENRDIARAMDYWPKGRTVVYGIAFDEGLQVVQQPLLTRAPATAVKEQVAFPLPQRGSKQAASEVSEASQEVPGSIGSEQADIPPDVLKKIILSIGKRLADGTSPDDLRKEFGIDGGRAHQQYNRGMDWISKQTESEEQV